MKHINLITYFTIFFLASFNLTNGVKILELSDRFLDVQKEGMWLIKFYAPWCGHCKRLEPIFKQVGQHLAHDPIRIGKIDCTRFPSVASHFQIRGYPTILFFKGDSIYTYEGDRNREDIVEFVKRLIGPPVKSITSFPELKSALSSRDRNFAFIGEPKGSLWEHYNEAAKVYQQHEFFIYIPKDVANQLTDVIQVTEDQEIVIFKDGTSFKFEDKKLIEDDVRSQRSLEQTTEGEKDKDTTQVKEKFINKSPLYSWIVRERFPLFMKITGGKFSHLMSTKKFVVMAVLEENKIGELSPDMVEFREMIKDIAQNKQDLFRKHFQFGWTGTPYLANSVAMETLSIPHLIVINATSYQHYLPDDEPMQLTPAAIEIFLKSILDGTAPVYGGSSYPIRLYRSFYEFKSSLYEMWQGNPTLTAVLFGLPLGFLALICYSICCADIMDAEEEDEEDEAMNHQKTE